MTITLTIAGVAVRVQAHLNITPCTEPNAENSCWVGVRV
jgi:hypothetical protein